MNSNDPNESSTKSPGNGKRSEMLAVFILKIFCALCFVYILVSAIRLAPTEPFGSGDCIINALIHMFLAILCLNISLLDITRPNAVANHGGIGILVGLVISFIFIEPLKGGPILFLFGAFFGAVFGLVIGIARRLIALAVSHLAPRNANKAESDNSHIAQDESRK
jgi:hypothetical protein